MDKVYFEEMKSKIAEFNKKMQDEGKQFFADQSKVLFEQNPTLVKFGWTQYTPYWNDGLSDPKVLFVDEDEDLYEERYYDDGEEGYKPYNTLVDFLSNFDEKDVEMLFGDHCEVIVTRDGVQVEEYEHD